MEKKNLSIESLRAIMIVLVVAGHVIGSDSMGGMKIAYPSIWRCIYLYIVYIQMPLFSAIAGWVFGLKSVGNIAFSSFVFNKFKRLLVPMAAVGTLYFLVQYFVPGTNTKGEFGDMWRIYLFPYSVFWYLQSLFLIFIVAFIADKLMWLEKFNRWILMLVVAYVLYVVQCVFVADKFENYFSFQGMMNQLVYFVAGVGIMRFGKELARFKKMAFFLAVVGVCLLQLHWFDQEYRAMLYKCLLPIWLFGALVIVVNLRIQSNLLARLGYYTYSIYLFHAFGTAGGRIILLRLGVNSELLIFVFSTIIAIAIPIVVDKVLSLNKYTRMVFLGKSM